MTNSFNLRTKLNYELRQDTLSTEAQYRMAKQRTLYRHRAATRRYYARLRVLDAVLVVACIMASVVLVLVGGL